MTDTPDPSHRTLHDAPAGAVSVREAEEVEDDDGMMEVRMPVASTGQVRNEGDTPLTPAELRGMAEQINAGRVGVFPEHGLSNAQDGASYSAFEKLGYWANAEIEQGASGDDEDLLVATARMPDPSTLPDVGAYRELLGVIKEQAKRGVPLSASIGWRDDEDYPGGVDLMEASIVGIGADPRTQTDTGTTALARAAVRAGADPDDLVAEVRRAVESRAEYEVGDETVDITPPDYMVNAADLAMQKSDEGLGSDCGTGVGDNRADQIRADEVGPDVVVEIAAYLTSHAEDVTAEGTPDEWTDEEWDDCGNMQYAKWGGLGTGTALEWAQARANAVADARDEDLPYPNRAGRNIDDPEFSEGDAVTWTWDDTPVHGRVAGVHEEFTPDDGPTITGEDGEAVYSIHEWDEEVEAFRRQNVAKPESSLSASDKEMPSATDENFQNMADEDTPDEGGTTDEQSAPDDGAETTRAPDDVTEDDLLTFTAMHFEGMDEEDLAESVDAADGEYIGECDPEALADLMSTATGAEYGDAMDALTELMDASDGDTDDEQGDYGDDDIEDDDDDEEEERHADPDTDDDTDTDLTERVAELEAALEDVRSGEVSVTSPQKEQAAESDEDDAEERAADDDTDSDPEPMSPTGGLGDYR
jgi:hypothetical protein